MDSGFYDLLQSPGPGLGYGWHIRFARQPSFGQSGSEVATTTTTVHPPGSTPAISPDNPGSCQPACPELAYSETAGVTPSLPEGSFVDDEVLLLDGRVRVLLVGSPYDSRIQITNLDQGSTTLDAYYTREAIVAPCFLNFLDVTVLEIQSACIQNANYAETVAPPMIVDISVIDQAGNSDQAARIYDLETMGRYAAGSNISEVEFLFFKQPTPVNPFVYIKGKDGRRIVRVTMIYQKFNGTEYRHFCGQDWTPGVPFEFFEARATGCEAHISNLTITERQELRGYLEVKTRRPGGPDTLQSAIYYFPDL